MDQNEHCLNTQNRTAKLKVKQSFSVKNNKGIVTIPFLLVLTIILFFILSFFGLTMTFAHISVSQYMAYSTSRKLFLSSTKVDQQRIAAINHYKNLRGQFFKPNAHTRTDSGGWFWIEEELPLQERTGYLKGYKDSGNPRGGGSAEVEGMFYGAGLQFYSRIVQFQIPFLIREQKSHGSARVNSYLGREPSQLDCEKFNRARSQEIEQFYSSLPGLNVVVNQGEGEGDNGC